MLRGDIYEIAIPRSTGHEQRGDRYAVVVQSDALLPRSVVLVAVTSTSARPATIRPEIEVSGRTTRVLVEQMAAVDATRLGELVGHVSPEEMWGIEDALGLVLDLR